MALDYTIGYQNGYSNGVNEGYRFGYSAGLKHGLQYADQLNKLSNKNPDEPISIEFKSVEEAERFFKFIMAEIGQNKEG